MTATTHKALQLVRMQSDDLDEVLDIEESVYSHPWSRNSFAESLKNNDDAWVARLPDGEMVGYFVQMVVLDESHLLTIAVKSALQGQRVGLFLLERLVERAKALGMRSVVLEVRVSNLRAIHVYESFGFKLIGRRKNYYQINSEQREDALIMQVQIAE